MTDELADADAAPPTGEPERDVASLLLAAYFVAMIVVVVALLVLPAIL
jgi:hypothetical protein